MKQSLQQWLQTRTIADDEMANITAELMDVAKTTNTESKQKFGYYPLHVITIIDDPTGIEHGPEYKTWISNNRHYALTLIPPEKSEPSEVRHEAMRELGRTFPFNNMHAVFLASEAWMGTNTEVMPSKDPKRQEILMVVGLARGAGPSDSLYCSINPDRTFGEVETMQAVSPFLLLQFLTGVSGNFARREVFPIDFNNVPPEMRAKLGL